MDKVLFYSKCRPQGVDAWPIARQYKRVFIGYPPWRKLDYSDSSTDWRTTGVSHLLIDLTDPQFESIERNDNGRGYKSAVTHHRNLASRIDTGSIVLVPRPSEGKCYAGEVSRPFELVDIPPWGDRYLDLRKASGCTVEDPLGHIGDVVQTWPIDNWHALPFVGLPRWISYRLLSRNTLGIIEDLADPPVSALGEVQQLLGRAPGAFFQPVRGAENLERALLDWLSPSIFELLVVELLQLEQPDVHWHHVGGSGDGGVDGIAVTGEGQLVGVLQCKWHGSLSPAALFKTLPTNVPVNHRIVAILHGHQDGPEYSHDGRFLNRQRMAKLVWKHRRELPLAKSLGIVD